jgi:glycosyltransferase involved in cell wall biosynthesis
MPKQISSPTPVVVDARVVAGSGGGPDKTILNSPRFLSAAGYRMLCAYMHPPGDPGFAHLRSRASALQAPLVSVPDAGPWDCSVIARLLHVCRRERVRIWHGHDYKSNVLGLLLRRFWPMRLVTTLHGWVKQTRRTPLYYKIDELCLPRYETVICVSQDLHDAAVACGVPPERCVLLENGIDLSQYTRKLAQGDAKRRLGVAPDQFVLGAVGRLSPEKGFDCLIRSVHELLRDGLNLALVIAGDGDDGPRLERLIDELGVRGRVRLLGYCADPRIVYEAVDMFVLSSVREGLPNVLLEAMASQVPVIATRIAGIPRLIQDGDNGLLVTAGDAAMLKRTLIRLCGDAVLRTRLGQAGQRTVEQRYSFAVRMRKLVEIYDQLLGRNRQQSASARRFAIPDERSVVADGTLPGSVAV